MIEPQPQPIAQEAPNVNVTQPAVTYEAIQPPRSGNRVTRVGAGLLMGATVALAGLSAPGSTEAHKPDILNMPVPVFQPVPDSYQALVSQQLNDAAGKLLYVGSDCKEEIPGDPLKIRSPLFPNFIKGDARAEINEATAAYFNHPDIAKLEEAVKNTDYFFDTPEQLEATMVEISSAESIDEAYAVVEKAFAQNGIQVLHGKAAEELLGDKYLEYDLSIEAVKTGLRNLVNGYGFLAKKSAKLAPIAAISPKLQVINSKTKQSTIVGGLAFMEEGAVAYSLKDFAQNEGWSADTVAHEVVGHMAQATNCAGAVQSMSGTLYEASAGDFIDDYAKSNPYEDDAVSAANVVLGI